MSDPTTISVDKETKERLVVFKNADLRERQSYDTVINTLLDAVGAPQADEIDDYYKDLNARLFGEPVE